MAGEIDVCMLWEAVDPHAALSVRFGFADGDQAVAWLDQALQEVWAGRLDRCHRLVMSGSNLLAWLTVDGREVVAKCCIDPSRFRRLAAVDALVSWLGERGAPVAAPLAAADGRPRVEHGRFSLGLSPVVAGDLLDATDPGQVEAAGRMLATLHQALAAYPHPFDDDDEMPQPATQLVHGDFRAANILVDGAQITAVLDFDEAAVRSRVADLGRSAVLLATRYHGWTPTDPETRRRFLTAYGELAPLGDAEQRGLDRTIEAVCHRFGWT